MDIHSRITNPFLNCDRPYLGDQLYCFVTNTFISRNKKSWYFKDMPLRNNGS